MENRLEIIAIDHGWSNIKTVNTVFSTAVNQIANEPGIKVMIQSKTNMKKINYEL